MIIDQLISPTDSFILTHRGSPTKKWYKGATIFVDHHSDITYAHLMTKMDDEHTVAVKLAFERMVQSYGVTIK